MWLRNTLPELQEKELRLRERLRTHYGITYTINEGSPNFAGLRTADTTAILLRWRDQHVAAARKAAEERRRLQGGSAMQIKAAGDVAAAAAHYRVAPFTAGFHGVGGAFDIKILEVGGSAEVARARQAGEAKRKQQGGSPVQVRESGKVAALNAAYDIAGREGEAVGLRWGGRFSAPRDVYHFELPYPREQVAARFAAMQREQVAKKESGGALAVALLALGGGLLYYATHGGGWRSVG